jgi:hypothetical protein
MLTRRSDMLVRLLSIETLKVKRRFFYILPFIVVVYTTFLCVVTIKLSEAAGKALSDYQEFNSFIGNIFSCLTIPVAIFVLYQIGNEFENKIVQKNIIYGLSRLNYFWSKVLYSFFVAIFFGLVLIIAASIIKYSLHHFNGVSFNEIIIACFGVILASFSLCMLNLFIIFLSKEVKKSILIAVGYVLAEFTLVRALDGLFSVKLPFALPIASIRNILLEGGETYHYVWQNTTIDAATIIVYPITFAFLAYYSFKKSDLPAI